MMPKLNVTSISRDSSGIEFIAESNDANIIGWLEGHNHVILELKSRMGILKDCHITGYDISLGDGDTVTECTLDGVALEYDPTVNVNLKDGKYNVLASTYYEIERLHGNPEEMTIDEFKQYEMAENI